MLLIRPFKFTVEGSEPQQLNTGVSMVGQDRGRSTINYMQAQDTEVSTQRCQLFTKNLRPESRDVVVYGQTGGGPSPPHTHKFTIPDLPHHDHFDIEMLLVRPFEYVVEGPEQQQLNIEATMIRPVAGNAELLSTVQAQDPAVHVKPANRAGMSSEATKQYTPRRMQWRGRAGPSPVPLGRPRRQTASLHV